MLTGVGQLIRVQASYGLYSGKLDSAPFFVRSCQVCFSSKTKFNSIVMKKMPLLSPENMLCDLYKKLTAFPNACKR